MSGRSDPPPLDLDAIEKRAASGAVIWSCSACGPHELSGPNWCAVGCGRDYSRMWPASVVDVAVLVAEVRRLRLAQDLYDTLQLVLDELGTYAHFGRVEKNAIDEGWAALARFDAAASSEAPANPAKGENE